MGRITICSVGDMLDSELRRMRLPLLRAAAKIKVVRCSCQFAHAKRDDFLGAVMRMRALSVTTDGVVTEHLPMMTSDAGLGMNWLD